MRTCFARRCLLVLGCAGILLLFLAAAAGARTLTFYTGPFAQGVQVAQYRALTLPYAVSDVQEAEVQCTLLIFTVDGCPPCAGPEEWTLVRELPMGTVRAVKDIQFGPKPSDYPFSFTWPRVDLEPGTYWCKVAATDGERWATQRFYCPLVVRSPVQINGGDRFTRTASVIVDYPSVDGWNYFMVRNRDEPWPDVWQPVSLDDRSVAWQLPAESDGVKTVVMGFTDAPGGAVTARSDSIILDTHGPITRAPHAERGKKGAAAWLHFRFDDSLSRCAQVGFIISRRGVEYKRLAPHWQPRGRVLARKFMCDLPRGRYTFTVIARDYAGNEQRKAGSNTLTVY